MSVVRGISGVAQAAIAMALVVAAARHVAVALSISPPLRLVGLVAARGGRLSAALRLALPGGASGRHVELVRRRSTATPAPEQPQLP